MRMLYVAGVGAVAILGLTILSLKIAAWWQIATGTLCP